MTAQQGTWSAVRRLEIDNIRPLKEKAHSTGLPQARNVI
jgi:hypothetical protein